MYMYVHVCMYSGLGGDGGGMGGGDGGGIRRARRRRRQSCRTDHSVLVWPRMETVSGEHVIPTPTPTPCAGLGFSGPTGYFILFYFICFVLFYLLYFNTC